MGNRLFHRRRIDDHPLQARSLDDVRAFGRFNRLGQQLFDAGFTQALTPARQARLLPDSKPQPQPFFAAAFRL